MRKLPLAIMAVLASACAAGPDGSGLVDGAQTALAVILIVFPILHVLAVRDGDPPPHR